MNNKEIEKLAREAGFFLPKGYIAKHNPNKQKRNSNEHEEQVKVFNWVRQMRETGDEKFALIFSIPNGSKRDAITAANLKKEGVLAGVPDIFVSYPTELYHGMYIEMKYGKNKTTCQQNVFLSLAKKFGYKCEVCYSAEEAIENIKTYLNIVEEN